MGIVQLFTRSNNAKHASAESVLNEAIIAARDGTLGDKVMVISMKSVTNSIETLFYQSGMQAHEMIALLELAKLNIYSNYMNGEKTK